MHTFMKYLVIKLFILFFFFFPKSIHTSDFDCADSWYMKNILQISNEIIYVKASIIINSDSSKIIDLFLDKHNNRFRIDYNKQIFILDKNKSIKIFENTNQLYIDNPDTVLYNMVFSVFSREYFDKNNIEVIENKYLIKNDFNFNQIELVYNNDCSSIEYINLESNKIDIYIDKIDVKIINDNNFFKFNEEYFKSLYTDFFNWKFILSILISVLFSFYAFKNFELNKLSDIIYKIDFFYIFSAMVLLLLSVYIRALRWQLLFNENKLSINKLFGSQLIGY